MTKSHSLDSIQNTVGLQLTPDERRQLLQLTARELIVFDQYLIRAKEVFEKAEERFLDPTPATTTACPARYQTYSCTLREGHRGPHVDTVGGQWYPDRNDDATVRKHLADGTTPPEGEYTVSTDVLLEMAGKTEEDVTLPEGPLTKLENAESVFAGRAISDYDSLLPDNSQAVETNQRRIAALSDPDRDK